jgi:hypothetical protein
MKKKKVIPTKHTRYTRLGVKHAESSEVIANGIIIGRPAFPNGTKKKPHSTLPLNPPEISPSKLKEKEMNLKTVN